MCLARWNVYFPLVIVSIGAKGRERNPPPCSRHLGQVVKGYVTLWSQSCHTPPPSPTLLASCEIADSLPNQTICPTRNCCHVLTEIAGQPGTDFSHRGGKEYTVHRIHTLYKHLAGSFWVLRQNLQQVAPIRKSPIPLPSTTGTSSILFIYLSVIGAQKRTLADNKVHQIGSIDTIFDPH